MATRAAATAARCCVATDMTLCTLANFGDLVGDETVAIAVNSRRRFGIGCADEAEDTTRGFVEPVLLVIDATAPLHFQVALMRASDSLGGQAVNVLVNIH